MLSKKLILVKFITVIGLSAIVLYFITNGSFSGVNGLPENDETIVKNALINPVKTNVSLRDSIVSFGMGLLARLMLKLPAARMDLIVRALFTMFFSIIKFRYHGVLHNSVILVKKSRLKA